MTLTDAGAPPASIRAYIEDMLLEIADLADHVNEPRLAAAVRQAGILSAEINARAWAGRPRDE